MRRRTAQSPPRTTYIAADHVNAAFFSKLLDDSTSRAVVAANAAEDERARRRAAAWTEPTLNGASGQPRQLSRQAEYAAADASPVHRGLTGLYRQSVLRRRFGIIARLARN